MMTMATARDVVYLPVAGARCADCGRPVPLRSADLKVDPEGVRRCWRCDRNHRADRMGCQSSDRPPVS